MSENTKNYCIFYNNLSPELKESIKNICEQAMRKSTIYSDTITAIDSFSNFYPDKNNIAQIVDKFTNQKEIMDTVLNLYDPKLLLKPLNYRDYFFIRLLKHCINEGSNNIEEMQRLNNFYRYNALEKFDELRPPPTGRGGKRRKSKKYKNKSKKSKKSKKRYSRKYR
jgi:hypothetical protein